MPEGESGYCWYDELDLSCCEEADHALNLRDYAYGCWRNGAGAAYGSVGPGGGLQIPELNILQHDQRSAAGGSDEAQTLWSLMGERFEYDSGLGRTSEPRGGVFEFNDLEHKTGKRQTADAVVYVPDRFDPSKPVRVLVYNHGLSTDAPEAFRNSELERQMELADPNTILIVPEWQTKTQSRESPNNAKFHEPGFFRGMLQEVLDKTPALQGRRVEDIASIGIITHSGGFKAAMSEMYKNGLYGKVTSLTVLDSMYNERAFDRWIEDNIQDLAAGRKRLQVIYTDHLAAESEGLAKRIDGMLARAGLPRSSMVVDKEPRTIAESATIADHGIVFKRSSVRIANRDAHNAMTRVYLERVLAAERRVSPR